ncbi:MAG: tRNA (guanosine(46)-N7)-methyltransferase TrmB [Alphaproteobacteria bacterium]|nr:tRNA (guanosine(46)-N7)-methyltransferase TrmB [Alphaproteobacteria bacterium]
MQENNQPKFFGRRKGRIIRKTKSTLLESFLPAIKIDENTVFDKETMFGKPVKKINLEIGFGDGVHLASQALNYPDIGFIGIEVFKNGVANLLTLITGIKDGKDLPDEIKLLENREDNIRVFDDDARLLFDKIPDGFVDRVFLLFPDPWPKKRHASRRFVNPDNLKALSRIIKKGGILRIATDHKVYKSWTLRTMHNCPDFKWTAKTSADWRNEPSDWVKTKYQQKAIREGRKPVFFEYERV